MRTPKGRKPVSLNVVFDVRMDAFTVVRSIGNIIQPRPNLLVIVEHFRFVSANVLGILA